MFSLIRFIIESSNLIENIILEIILVKITQQKNKKSTDENLNNELPIYYGFRSIGFIGGNFFGGRIIKHYSNQFSFLITSIIPLLMIFMVFLFDENNLDNSEKEQINIKEDFEKIKLIFKRYY